MAIVVGQDKDYWKNSLKPKASFDKNDTCASRTVQVQSVSNSDSNYPPKILVPLISHSNSKSPPKILVTLISNSNSKSPPKNLVSSILNSNSNQTFPKKSTPPSKHISNSNLSLLAKRILLLKRALASNLGFLTLPLQPILVRKLPSLLQPLLTIKLHPLMPSIFVRFCFQARLQPTRVSQGAGLHWLLRMHTWKLFEHLQMQSWREIFNSFNLLFRITLPKKGPKSLKKTNKMSPCGKIP